jgi:hypothetical protein
MPHVGTVEEACSPFAAPAEARRNFSPISTLLATEVLARGYCLLYGRNLTDFLNAHCPMYGNVSQVLGSSANPNYDVKNAM